MAAPATERPHRYDVGGDGGTAELARLIEHGDPSDPKTLRRMAALLGSTDPDERR
jgi:hypothetical protein